MITRGADYVNNFFPDLLDFLVLVVEHTVTVALEIGIRNLLPELLADAAVVLGALQAAGTVAAGALQALPDRLYHFRIVVEFDCHTRHILSFFLIIQRLGLLRRDVGLSLIHI